MLKKSAIIIRKRKKKKSKNYLLIFMNIILLVTLLLFFGNREFFSRVYFIKKNTEEILYLNEEFLIFSDGEKKNNYNLKNMKYREVDLNLKNRKIINVFSDNNILFQEGNLLINTLGDIQKIENLDRVIIVGDFIIIKSNKNYGVFDNRLNIIIPVEYKSILKGDKYFLVKDINNKIGYLDLKGKTVVSFEYDIGNIDKNGEMVVGKNNKVGVINGENKKIIDLEYENLIYLSPNSIIKEGNNFYFYSPNAPKRKLNISWAGLYNGETLFYSRDSKFGLMDKNGNELTKNIYEELEQNNIGTIITKKDGKYGLLNQQGKEVVQNIYNYIIPIKKYFFIAELGEENNAFIINFLGKKLFFEDRYDSYYELNKDFIVVSDKEKRKIINRNGRFLDDVEEILAHNEEWFIYKNKFGTSYIHLKS